MTGKRSAGLILMIGAAAAAFAGGSGESSVQTEIARAGTPVTIEIDAGEHYVHRMQIMPLISVKNAPQMAVWTETADGEFLETLFVTNRIGRQEWRGAPGDSTPTEEIRRQEALPVWAHARANAQDGAMLLPTRENQAPDAVTSATPDTGFELTTSIPSRPDTVVVFLEVNASTDFNDAYPKDAAPGSPGFSGGEWGSGQPALVYRAMINPDDPAAKTELELVGHASPDGSDGTITPQLGGITTARTILESVRITRPDAR